MPLAPEYQTMLAEMAAVEGPPISAMEPAMAREVYRMMRPLNPDLPVGAVADTQCPGPGGSLALRIYRPEGPGPFPILINFHGGGWVIGDLDTADAACRQICAAAACVVVSVDYRLAPEHPYPAAVDDALAATRWVAEQAEALGGNGRLAVGGESAGGNLAAVVARRVRDEGGPAIHCQLLLYPVTDSDFSRPSYAENGAGYLLETDTMRWFWDHYCPDTDRRRDQNAAPLRAEDLSDLPPAVIVTAEFDPLRDEGAAYAEALKAAGTAVGYRCIPGLVHDFFATAALFECSRGPFNETMAAFSACLANG